MRHDENDLRAPVVVIGGGLAGLAATATVARAGLPVRCLEAGSTLGGRAKTEEPQPGFRFNQGPHALYRTGAGARVLGDLGVDVQGRRAPAAGLALRDGRLGLLPSSAITLLRTRLLDVPSKWALGKLLACLPGADPAGLVGRTVDDWIATVTSARGAREALRALVRLSTYVDAPGTLDAGAAVAQLKRGADGGVDYVDGGWSRIVDALAETAEAAGATLAPATRAQAVDHDDRGRLVVRRADGDPIPARAVVLAVSPRVAQRLAPQSGDVRRATERVTPVRLACLDVALGRAWPRRAPTFLLGLDEPTYLSVHSTTARLAPDDGALIHAAENLPLDAEDGASASLDVRARLARLLERLAPGWRDHAVHTRFLSSAIVAHDLPRAAAGGLPGRPPVVVGDVPGLALAGDWVGPEGMLADAALASGQAAGRAAIARARGVSDASRAPGAYAA